MACRITRRTFTSSITATSAPWWPVSFSVRAHANSEDSRKATSCIFLWMGGGMCHVDTFDPKRVGDPQRGQPGSAYKDIPTAIPEVRVCEHLSRTARVLDRGLLLRSIHHPISAEHAAPTNLVKTGRPTSGTIVYPSIGSVVSHELGSRAEGMPGYVVMGYPNVTRGPGFLGAQFGYVYLVDTNSGPNGLVPVDNVGQGRRGRRRELMNLLRTRYLAKQTADPKIHDYDATIEQAYRLAGPDVIAAFDLSREPDALRNRYGDEFGQRCLLARRLVDRGVRFVEASFNLNFINGTGWDTHEEGQKNQHELIESLDRALSALIEDLEQRGLLDSTLVVLATEFGRPPDFDGGGGRGHQSTAFTTLLFGGGLKTGQAIGVTDEWGRTIVSRPISVPDWHATIYAALGIDPSKELYAGERPVPITDHGRPLPEVNV